MFRQCFELEVCCKKSITAYKRFASRFPAVDKDWGIEETFCFMEEAGLEKYADPENGWCFWRYCDEDIGTHYLALVVRDEYYKVV